MKKLISAVTSLCMAATMVSAVVPASVGAADASKGFAVKTFDINKPASADAKSSITLDKQKDFTANGYTLPSALYFSEGTENTTTSFLVHLTTDSPDITFKVYEPDQPYTASEQNYTLKSGTATTDCYVSFGGSYDDFDGYLSAGLYKFGVDTSQTAAGTNNAFLGCSWMNMGVDYAWAGEKSDSFPAYVFDTIIPASIPVGTYKITYCKYDTDPDPDNTVMAPMIESKFNGQKVKYDVASGNLTLEEMTITITDGDTPPQTSTTTVTTVQQTTTTTNVVTSVGDKDFNFTFADSTGATAVNANPGDTVTVNANVNAGTNTCAGMDVQFDTGALEITKIGASSKACANAKVSSNPSDKRANFTSTDTNGDPVAVTNGSAAFSFIVQIPANATNGTTYKVGFADGECKVFKEGGTGDKYSAGFTPLTITVGEGGTTVSQTNPNVSTTTTQGQVVQNGEFKFTFADANGSSAINAEAGATVNVNVNVDAGSNKCAGMDVQFDTGALEITKIGAKSAACANAKVSSNPADKRANFTSTDTDGEPVAVTSGAAAFAFQVQIPANAAKGTVYTIGFADGECKVFKEGGTGDKYTTSFAPLTITVGDGNVGTTVSTTSNNGTTTTTQVVQNGEFKFTFADANGSSAINVDAGATVNVNVNVDAGSNKCAGMDVQFDTGALEITKIGAKSAACANAKVSSNPADKRANFTSTDTDGEPVAVTSGAAAFAFQVQIPADAAKGTKYTIGFADGECKVFKEGGTGDKYTTSFAPLTITVGEEDTTTSATTTTVTTTTTTVTTTTVTSTTDVTTTTTNTNPGQKLAPTWGDVNCDGVVNVADVVVLNRFLNDPTYPITAQGKVNGDVKDPQDKSGTAVDPAGVQLTAADSETILKAIVELVTLPQ